MPSVLPRFWLCSAPDVIYNHRPPGSIRPSLVKIINNSRPPRRRTLDETVPKELDRIDRPPFRVRLRPIIRPVNSKTSVVRDNLFDENRGRYLFLVDIGRARRSRLSPPSTSGSRNGHRVHLLVCSHGYY